MCTSNNILIQSCILLYDHIVLPDVTSGNVDGCSNLCPFRSGVACFAEATDAWAPTAHGLPERSLVSHKVQNV